MFKSPEALTLASPFSPGYWRVAAKEVKNLRMLTLAAIVVALRIALGGLRIPLGDNLNIFFGYLINGLGSAIYGPVMALLSGFASDILGYFIHPNGPFFPGYVLSTMMGSFLYALFFYRARITLLRVALVSFTFGNAYSFWYSLAGAVLSFLIMALLRRQDWFGELGVSVAGGVCHNIGQIAVAAIVLRSTAAAYYLPVLLLSGVLTGMAVGAAAAVLIRRIPPFER